MQLDSLPAGVSPTAALAGEHVTILREAFLLGHGSDFIARLEGVMSDYGQVIESLGLSPSVVDRLLRGYSPDRQVTVYCNELRLQGQVRLPHPAG